MSAAGSSTGRNWLWIGRALLALLLLVPALPAQASVPARLAERCRIAADPATPLPDILRRLDRCEALPPSSYRGTIWISYAPPFEIDAKTWRLALDNHRVRGVDLWMIAPGGAAERVSYDPNSRDREWLAGNYFSILFTAHGPVDQLVLRLTDSETHTFVRAPKLARARVFAPIERNEAALYGASVGMLALTILFHLTLFFAIRRRFQLIYCAHVALLFGYALCYSGMIRMLAPDLTAGGISRILSFTMAGATGTGLAFIIEFLKTSIPRGVRRWASGAVVGSGVAAVALAVTPPAWSHAVYLGASLVALHTILLATGILIAACLRGQAMAGMLALGWVVPIAVSLMYPARTFGLISAGTLPDGMMILAATLECLILSLPVAARIRDLRIDHERARERHVVLERQAQTDSLTGLANRRGFGEALIRAEAAHAEPMPLALLVIDIDHFKRVNDHHGHAAGDAILQHVAALVARVAGAGAIVSRYGGEEFVVALRGYDLMRAGTMAERIRNSIGVTFDPDVDLPRVTVSIGVAAGFSDDIETVLEDADCALYRAKNEGRNRVMLADGPIVYAAAA